jgi:hypothetical protein
MNKRETRLSRIVRGFQGRRVAVLGDYILDEFLRGEATRISPEAPVPVVLIQDHNSTRDYAGGAGNVAANIASLGGRPGPHTGREGSMMKEVAPYCICVPADSAPRIQEAHILIGHVLSQITELELFGRRVRRRFRVPSSCPQGGCH